MSQGNEKRKFKSVEDYLREIKEGAKGAPSVDEILKQFEQNDFSSLDPDALIEAEKDLSS